jgi:hypothetical protein
VSVFPPPMQSLSIFYYRTFDWYRLLSARITSRRLICPTNRPSSTTG